MVFDKLLITLEKLKVARVSGKTVLRPLTREQIYILSAFEIPAPNPVTLELLVAKKRCRKPKHADISV